LEWFFVFYDDLKRICNEKGIKMTPLIIQCGGSSGLISRWKKGSMPNSKMIIELAKKLEVSTDYLLGVEEVTHP